MKERRKNNSSLTEHDKKAPQKCGAFFCQIVLFKHWVVIEEYQKQREVGE